MSTRQPASPSRAPWPSLLALTLALVSLGACGLDLSPGIEARDTWTRTYTLEKGGTLDIRESNGRIRITAVDGDQLEVNATRIVKASTEQAAKDELGKFDIRETSSPSLVQIDSTSASSGFNIGLTRRVDYDVKVPRWANVTLKAANGEITVADVGGRLVIDAVNGAITATDLGDSAEVETVNGRVELTFARLGDNGVRCETTNGMIAVTVPKAAKATITATVINGAISTDNLDVTDTDDGRRRFEGTLNGGGAEIRLSTTNGAITITGR